MKTLSEHNEERCKSDRTIPRGQQMSIACDNCGAEMVNEYLAAQGDAHIDLVCLECGYEGVMEWFVNARTSWCEFEFFYTQIL